MGSDAGSDQDLRSLEGAVGYTCYENQNIKSDQMTTDFNQEMKDMFKKNNESESRNIEPEPELKLSKEIDEECDNKQDREINRQVNNSRLNLDKSVRRKERKNVDKFFSVQNEKEPRKKKKQTGQINSKKRKISQQNKQICGIMNPSFVQDEIENTTIPQPEDIYLPDLNLQEEKRKLRNKKRVKDASNKSLGLFTLSYPRNKPEETNGPQIEIQSTSFGRLDDEMNSRNSISIETENTPFSPSANNGINQDSQNICTYNGKNIPIFYNYVFNYTSNKPEVYNTLKCECQWRQRDFGLIPPCYLCSFSDLPPPYRKPNKIKDFFTQPNVEDRIARGDDAYQSRPYIIHSNILELGDVSINELMATAPRGPSYSQEITSSFNTTTQTWSPYLVTRSNATRSEANQLTYDDLLPKITTTCYMKSLTKIFICILLAAVVTLTLGGVQMPVYEFLMYVMFQCSVVYFPLFLLVEMTTNCCLKRRNRSSFTSTSDNESMANNETSLSSESMNSTIPRIPRNPLLYIS